MEPCDHTSPVKDIGVSRDISDNDIDHNAMDHRQAMYIGLRLPKRPRRPVKKSRSKKQSEKTSSSNGTIPAPVYLSPSEQIQNLLVEVDDEEHFYHDVFCQMDMLHNNNGEYEWREAARWVKYEEDVEEGGERWSKPHVASLSLHSLFELRSSLLSGAVMLDMDAHNMAQAIDLLLDNLVNAKLLEESMKDTIRCMIVRPHFHQHMKRKKSFAPTDDQQKFRKSMKRTFSEIGRQFSGSFRQGPSNANLLNSKTESFLRGNNSSPNIEMLNGALPESPSLYKLNEQFMRKLPSGSEVANILVGEVEPLKYQVTAFIRLRVAKLMDMAEVPLPTRFIFLCLGPPGSQSKLYEIGRSISTIMVDEVFGEVAYKARGRQDLLAGIDEFLDQVTVLPPGEWDPNIRIEPPAAVPSQGARKSIKPPNEANKEEEEEEASHCDPTLVRTGRLFGGLVADIRRKVQWYASDFKDALHLQCVASIVFLYLATLTPNVTFGGLLGQATDQYMGTMECILTAAITGVLFALFSGQPLNILGSTGPMLVLEMILYTVCRDKGFDFLPMRCWIGIWTTVILLLVVMFDLSALVRYITRFTEESFASLIAIIFIVEAFKKTVGIIDKYPVHTQVPPDHSFSCECLPANYSQDNGKFIDVNITSSNYTQSTLATVNYTYFNSTELPSLSNCLEMGGQLVGPDCKYAPDVFFLSILLFLGTFTVANGLQSFKTSRFFPTWVRQNLSDFSVLISIISMVGIDVLLGIPTPKLNVPREFKPTRPNREWFINPVSDKNPWWVIPASIIPALLAVILIFMDQQITAVIVNRKENKLKKGSGYHLDMFVVAICILICSLLGLPWYVAATVSALAHVMSLKKESECTAPGERAAFLGVREQRVTALMVGLLSGLSVLFTSVLSVIPMPVLYGVFLYMGVAALKGMQLVDRVLLVFMPSKYQPDHMYLRHVPIKRVHLFTFMQIVCLVVLWVIKTIKSVSIVFPIMVLATCFVRKAMDRVFTQRELKWLDDIMPEATTREKEDREKRKNGLDEEEGDSLLEPEEYEKLMEVKIQHEKQAEKYGGHLSNFDLDRVNISEEVNKTAIWLQVIKDGENPTINPENTRSSRRRKSDRSSSKSERRSKDRHRKDYEKNECEELAKDASGANTEKNEDSHEERTVDFYIQGEDDPDRESRI